jgi:RHH-type transcriptional regulator, proline utilization regulon repressor / proline dehydrogenase / delta 1-pyrroline-5-carboxylate dehydrogenase
MLGTVVGVQPFGGIGLSGTGPKAGGPLTLYRLLATRPSGAVGAALRAMGAVRQDQRLSEDDGRGDLGLLAEWAEVEALPALAACCRDFSVESLTGTTWLLRGPTGERNSYSLRPRDRVLCLADNPPDLLVQLAAVLAVGSRALWLDSDWAAPLHARLPAGLRARVDRVADWTGNEVAFDAVLHHGDGDHLREVCRRVADRPGAIVSVTGLHHGDPAVPLERLVVERSVSVNTAAAGGDASLMTVG